MSSSPTVIDSIEEEEPIRKEVRFFGRDLNKIHCFKESFLYGLLGGIGLGLITFTATSRVGKATNVTVFSFTGIVLVYWINCRISHSRHKFVAFQTEKALRERDLKITSTDATTDDNRSNN